MSNSWQVKSSWQEADIPPDATAALKEETPSMRSLAKRQIVIGLVIAGVGLLISLGSYQTASENGGGGYVVLWGAVVFGLIKAFRGMRLYLMAGPERPNAVYAPQQITPPARMPAPPPIVNAPRSADDDLAGRIRLGQSRVEGSASPLDGA
jgi:hypothetical protein